MRQQSDPLPPLVECNCRKWQTSSRTIKKVKKDSVQHVYQKRLELFLGSAQATCLNQALSSDLEAIKEEAVDSDVTEQKKAFILSIPLFFVNVSGK